MLYELLWLLTAVLAVYGLYALFSRHFSEELPGELPLSEGIHVRLGFSEEELEEALERLRREPRGSEPPVLLVDCPLRPEVLWELDAMGAELYVSYEEYYRETRKKRPLGGEVSGRWQC
ncbi:MAG: hypothetical protein IJF73_03260 [Clostridia bacterium]|nr:hypothetical protein [Clostridia bacterium]